MTVGLRHPVFFVPKRRRAAIQLTVYYCILLVVIQCNILCYLRTGRLEDPPSMPVGPSV